MRQTCLLCGLLDAGFGRVFPGEILHFVALRPPDRRDLSDGLVRSDGGFEFLFARCVADLAANGFESATGRSPPSPDCSGSVASVCAGAARIRSQVCSAQGLREPSAACRRRTLGLRQLNFRLAAASAARTAANNIIIILRLVSASPDVPPAGEVNRRPSRAWAGCFGVQLNDCAPTSRARPAGHCHCVVLLTLPARLGLTFDRRRIENSFGLVGRASRRSCAMSIELKCNPGPLSPPRKGPALVAPGPF
jgi:hypothetical protein